MVLETIKSQNHGSKLTTDVAALFDNPTRYSDVRIQIGTVTFHCHKFILALQSTYFQQHLFGSGTQTQVHQFSIQDVTPEDFKNVLCYMYKGEVQLDDINVWRIVRLAKIINLDELEQICSQYMLDTLNIDNCVQYWKYDEDNTALGKRCLQLFTRDFDRVIAACGLQEIPQELMEAVIESDDLNVNSETDVCDTVMKWFDSNKAKKVSFRPLKLLSQIRWSAVPVAYIKSKMIVNEMLKKDQQCFEYLSKVISYRLSGIHFEGLRSSHRPSSGVETCVLLFGTSTGHVRTAASHRVSLQQGKSIAIAEMPTTIKAEAAACVINNSAYVSGIGESCNETWRWDPVGGWAPCGDMVEGRRRHCATFVDSTSMYALGGFVDLTETTLSSVELFDTVKNKWTTVGKLVHAARNAGCASYMTSVYLFGGAYEDTAAIEDDDLDWIQVFDTSTKQCSVLTQRLPRGERLLRAVLWETSVILMNNRTCLIFDLNDHNIQQRDQFKADIIQFGLVLNNQTLFVIGGGDDKTDASGEMTWTCTDEVKYVPVVDIVNNLQTVKWTQHATKLTSPSMVSAYALMTLAVV